MASSIAIGPGALVLVSAAALDLALGDPDYQAHPVRLIGRMLVLVEGRLRRLGLDGYGGGIALFALLASASLLAAGIALWIATLIHPLATAVVHVFLLYSMLALGSLLRHGEAIESALRVDDLAAARAAVGRLVGRDTDRMDPGACRRAAVESLAENLTDAVVSPLFWYVIGGLPLLIVFKVVSTMDSMVGYRTPEYLRFGWCGARLDDVMNWVPARMTWLIIAGVAAAVPGGSAREAIRVGWSQHAVLPGPNSGWSEAAAAGALRRRLVGPVWSRGRLVTDVWLGTPDDPPLQSAHDYRRASALVAVSGILATAIAAAVIAAAH
jgi:adenosylcobinamide-phosphate synthase